MQLRLVAVSLAFGSAYGFSPLPSCTSSSLTLNVEAGRREFSAAAASALVGMSLAPLPSFAASKIKGCLPGTNPTSGYTVGVFEHCTPNFKDWHKQLDGFGKDLLSVYPPECKVVREGFVKTSLEGGDGVLAFLVFENSGLKAVTNFFDEKTSPIIAQGRKEVRIGDTPTT